MGPTHGEAGEQFRFPALSFAGRRSLWFFYNYLKIVSCNI